MHSTPRGHIFLKSHMHRGAGGGRCRRLTLLIRRPAGRCRPRPRSSVRPTPDLASILETVHGGTAGRMLHAAARRAELSVPVLRAVVSAIETEQY